MADQPSTPSTPASSAPAQSTPAANQNAPQTTGNTPQNPQSSAPVGKTDAIKGAQAQQTLNNPNASTTAKKEAAKTIKAIKYKYNGVESTEQLPYEIPNTPEAIEYARNQLQLAKMAHSKAQEKSAMEKDVLAFINDLKTNPMKALQDPAIGMDIKKFVADFMEKEIADSQKSPEQKELEALREQLRFQKEQQDRELQQRQAEDQARQAEQFAKDWDDQMSAALDNNKIPKSPAAVGKVIEYMRLALNAGKDVNVNDIIPIVREELLSDYQTHLNNLPEDELENFITKPILDKIRKRSIARTKQANQNAAVQAPGKTQSTGVKSKEEAAAKPKQNYKQFFKLNR